MLLRPRLTLRSPATSYVLANFSRLRFLITSSWVNQTTHRSVRLGIFITNCLKASAEKDAFNIRIRGSPFREGQRQLPLATPGILPVTPILTGSKPDFSSNPGDRRSPVVAQPGSLAGPHIQTVGHIAP